MCYEFRSVQVLCELAVAIAKCERATDPIIHRASELIVTVSLKCRHKGAIESAGVAIANLTKYCHVVFMSLNLFKCLNLIIKI